MGDFRALKPSGSLLKTPEQSNGPASKRRRPSNRRSSKYVICRLPMSRCFRYRPISPRRHLRSLGLASGGTNVGGSGSNVSDGPVVGEELGTSRRTLIKRAGAGAVAIWVAPTITRTAVAAAGSPVPLCASCSLCGANLIQNPGAEIGSASANSAQVFPPPSWTVVQGEPTQFQYGTAGSIAEPDPATDPVPPQPDRGDALFAGGPNGVDEVLVSILTQTVSLASIDAIVDACSLGYTLSAWLGGFGDQNDRAVLTATFRDGSLVTLDTATIGPVTDAERGNQTGLQFRTTSGTLPVGTRSVLMTLTFTTDIATYNNGYADVLSFVLTP